MQSIQLVSHVNAQGILHIQLPFELANQEVEITLNPVFKDFKSQPSSNPALLKDLVGAFECEETTLSENYKAVLSESWSKKYDHG
jgi:hypothetical protein